MNPMRSMFLGLSRNRWLGRQLPQRAFVRRAVRRFMPGEELEDALGATAALAKNGIGSILTRLGENVTSIDEAEAEAMHYLEVMDRVHAAGLPAWPSVKLTHLGLDVDSAGCERRLMLLAAHAMERGSFLWIDMEDSSYVDATLDLYRRAREAHPRVGVCLQAYLRRTGDDLEKLLPLEPAIRLVKGAYAEPAAIAYPSKREVDERYLALGERLLEVAQRGGAFPVFGTHDTKLIAALRARAAALHLAAEQFEFHLLYGVGVADQRALAGGGASVRVLISYGRDWFPWYMRRLAERPANVWFVLRNIFRR